MPKCATNHRILKYANFSNLFNPSNFFVVKRLLTLQRMIISTEPQSGKSCFMCPCLSIHALELWVSLPFCYPWMLFPFVSVNPGLSPLVRSHSKDPVDKTFPDTLYLLASFLVPTGPRFFLWKVIYSVLWLTQV